MTKQCFKNLLGGAVLLALCSLNIESLSHHHLTFNTKVEAADLPVETIYPNQSKDTGNHNLDTSYVQDITNWKNISKKTSPQWD